jgi:broad specificity phosphatase PhoE
MPWFERPLRLWILAALVIVSCALAIGAWVLDAAPTTLLIVRHADRADRDDALSPRGTARAAALARALARANLRAIYHSDTSRARDTAAPLAALLGLTPKVRPARDTSGLVREILTEHRGEQVLIVGHSNTVPQMIRAAGGPDLPDLAEDAFDDLFVLTAVGRVGRRVTLVHLTYGDVAD